MRTFFLFSLLLCCLGVMPMQAQQTYTLEEIIQLAQANSPVAQQAENRKENFYWRYRVFKSNYLPQLSLDGGGTFSNTNDAVRQPDGSIDFVPVNQLNANGVLSLSQAVAPLGGTVSLRSDLNRFSDFSTDPTVTNYRGNPIFVQYDQPVFRFNNLRWDERIEPVVYEESKRTYNQDYEQIAFNATEFFFNVLLSQVSVQIAETHLANNDTIYRIGQGRYELGKIAENELLQLELNFRNSQQQLIQAELDLETNTLRLNNYLGNKDNEGIVLVEPDDIPVFEVDPDLAISEAKANGQEFLSFRRRRLEAEREVARSIGQTGLDMTIFANYGFTNQGTEFGDVYQSPQSQSQAGVQLSIPLVDWGRQKAQKRTAQANQELTRATIDQEEVNFEQEIFVAVRQFDIQRRRVESTDRAAEIAQRRYDISQKRYFAARISVTDLNIALQEKDQAKQQYLQALRDYWQSYYNIRVITLYDFERGEPINYAD